MYLNNLPIGRVKTDKPLNLLSFIIKMVCKLTHTKKIWLIAAGGKRRADIGFSKGLFFGWERLF